MTNENYSPRPWPWPEHPPGSSLAMQLGCTCSPLSNNSGDPLGSCGTGIFFIAANCRYHEKHICEPYPPRDEARAALPKGGGA